MRGRQIGKQCWGFANETLRPLQSKGQVQDPNRLRTGEVMRSLRACVVGNLPRARRAFGDRAVNDLVERAKALAYRAHEGQVDKAGRPYIEHVARVAAAVSDDPEAEAVAWLHDVAEDCAREFEHEVFMDFPDPIYLAMYVLTDDGVCSKEDLYYSIRQNPVALRVKLADIADNSDEARLALLDPNTADRLRKKYKRALKMLGVSHAD